MCASAGASSSSNAWYRANSSDCKASRWVARARATEARRCLSASSTPLIHCSLCGSGIGPVPAAARLNSAVSSAASALGSTVRSRLNSSIASRARWTKSSSESSGVGVDRLGSSGGVGDGGADGGGPSRGGVGCGTGPRPRASRGDCVKRRGGEDEAPGCRCEAAAGSGDRDRERRAAGG